MLTCQVGAIRAVLLAHLAPLSLIIFGLDMGKSSAIRVIEDG